MSPRRVHKKILKKKTIKFEIDNLKCAGCENTISLRLMKFEGVKSVSVNADNSLVEVECSDENDKAGFLKALAKLGYPE